MSKWTIIAKIKLFKDLSMGYLSLWVYLLIVLEYFKINVSIYYIILFLAGCLGLTIVDWFFIYPKYQQITWEKNPAYDELRKNKNEKQ